MENARDLDHESAFGTFTRGTPSSKIGAGSSHIGMGCPKSPLRAIMKTPSKAVMKTPSKTSMKTPSEP